MMLRKKHKKLWIIGCCIVFLFGVYLFFSHAPTFYRYKTVSVDIEGSTYTVALADTQGKRAHGLSGTTQIPYNGMLFVFDTPSTYSFWMKDMHYPLDFIWLDENKKVVDLHTDITPESYPGVITPIEPVLYVLEVPSGFIQKHNIKKGDRVFF